ncbi:YjgF-like protein [Schizopora paradoxa]|uniref:YjgF-like protein n=1 Tax=Schizopora paradoxa TaxID=27342 RepID=A0A0H2RS93_9AGAM|nr:YjgF-like protein [Schizopora paradoxa]
MPQIVYTPDATPTLPVFSQAVISRGHVYVSGTVGCIDDLKTLAPGGVQAETRVALQNMAKVLKAAGSGLEHIVKANVYLLHRDRDFDAMNEVYLEFFKKDAMPARTCVGVASLPMGALVEIDCVAEIPSAEKD